MTNLPIPLTQAAIPMLVPSTTKQLAQGFAQQQPTSEKSEQVYYNTLAVLIVNNYLKMLGFKTDLSHCDSWNPLMRLTMNVADIELSGLGYLECRPVYSKGDRSPSAIYVPSEVQDQRIGYVAVQIEADEAWLLGYSPEVSGEYVALADLQTMDGLLTHLDQIHQLKQGNEALITHLGHWFQDHIEQGWMKLEVIIAANHAIAPRFRSATMLSTDVLRAKPSRLTRAKLLSFSDENQTYTVVLIVEVSSTDSSEFDIELMVCPIDDQDYLPAGMDIRILDEQDSQVMQAQTREENQLVEFIFGAEKGDRFSLQLVYHTTVLLESFKV
ncbi:MAG: DUF1822 family protein [Elainellaceae cyanobacterium]